MQAKENTEPNQTFNKTIHKYVIVAKDVHNNVASYNYPASLQNHAQLTSLHQSVPPGVCIALITINSAEFC